jgi:hypothetical protein
MGFSVIPSPSAELLDCCVVASGLDATGEISDGWLLMSELMKQIPAASTPQLLRELELEHETPRGDRGEIFIHLDSFETQKPKGHNFARDLCFELANEGCLLLALSDTKDREKLFYARVGGHS